MVDTAQLVEQMDEASYEALVLSTAGIQDPNTRFEQHFLTGGGRNDLGGEDFDTLYWRLDGPVWNNDGDTAYLRDGDGNIVDTYSGP